MHDKDRIAARIRALRAKTTENGCTEEEAAAAAAMVASLLAKYNMTAEEADVRENGFAREQVVVDDPVGERLWKIADGIAHMIDVRYWASRPGEQPSVTFFGFDHEVEIAVYLLDICRNAMTTKQAEEEFKGRLHRPSVRRRNVGAFLDGMADRLRERIRALKPEVPTGTGLVVLRNQLIDAEMENEGIKLDSSSARASRDLEAGYADGQRAGDAVALNRGVRGPGTDTLRIGR